MEMIWFSPNGFVTGDPTLKIDYPSVSNPSTIVTCSSLVGSFKWIYMALPLPPGRSIEQITVCYQVSDARSYISQVRLTEMDTPDKATVEYDDGTPLKSTMPICYIGQVGGYTPAAAVNLNLRLEFTNITDSIFLGGVGVGFISDCDAEKNEHTLGEFGPYDTINHAYSTLDIAVADILAQGGGVLCIPHDAPSGFYPRNLNEKGIDKPAVTIVDYRQGVERIYVPSVGVTNSEDTAVSGRIIERDLAVNLSWQNTFSTMDIASRYLGGASSYFTVLAQDVAAGMAQRVYLPTLRGIFFGQVLLVDPGAAQEWITVQDLGIDSTGNYIIADLTSNHPKGAYIYNKNNVGGLTITDTANCDNQSASLSIERTTYGTGDTFGIGAILKYQGNINSGLGDEGGVGIAANIEHDINCFYGQVESWDLANHNLIYAPPGLLPQTLGMSRPIINLNETKWLVDGTVKVIANSYIIGDKTASDSWSMATDPIVGRFIAINDPSEYYEKAEASVLGPTVGRVYRWWHIISVDKTTAGAWKLYVERAVIVNDDFNAPTLILADNYGKDLNYIIAPGAWASDVRDAVAGNLPGNIGAATAADKRTIKLAPSQTDGTSLDFEMGDPITNPPGPDVWMPTAFRARNLHNFPATLKGISFLSENLGKVQMDSGLIITGSGDSSNLVTVKDRMKDKSTEYQNGILIQGSTEKAFVIRGAVETSAIELWQTNKNIKRIRWLDASALIAGDFYVDPTSGNFIFAGKGLDLSDTGTINQKAISGTDTAAANLGKTGVVVPDAATTTTVNLMNPELDNKYAVFVECAWLTTKAVINKTTTSFDVKFGTAPSGGEGKLDWFLVRVETA